MVSITRSECASTHGKRHTLFPLILSTMVFAHSAGVSAAEPFEPLFNGRNLNGWFTFDNTHGTSNDVEDYFKVEDGELVILDIPETNENKAFGYLSTVNEYADYHLRFEYQWGEKKFAPRQNALRDSGVLYHLVGTDRIWPSSLESQVQEGDTGDFFGLGGARVTSSLAGREYSATGTVAGNTSQARANTVADTLDGWNVSEVVVRGDSAVHIVNGQVVNRVWDARLNGEALTAGRIGFQAEGATIRYRNIEIRQLASSVPRILLFSETRGFRHGSIPEALDSLEELANSAGMEVDRASNSAGVFTDSNLAGYDAVVWVMTTGDVLNDDEQEAFEHYIRSGGGYAGIHSASDTEYDWPWYGDLVGAYFDRHPSIQAALQNVEDRSHPSTEHLGSTWTRTDEWYDFRSNPRARVNVLLSLDESSYSGGRMGNDHPIAWYHEFDGGRAWYTGGGHTVSSYAEDDFQAHLLGGIRYAAGIDGDSGGPVTPLPPRGTGDALDRSDWVVTASQSQRRAGPDNAIDADSDTRWSTGASQAPGMYFQVDLGSVTSIDGIELDAGPEATDYPRGYEVLVSDNGADFSRAIASGTPTGRTTTIEFPAVATRYLRIVQTGSIASRWWSIHEINVSAADDTPQVGTSAPLDPRGWSATASSSQRGAAPEAAFDNDPGSRWSTGARQVPGQWFLIDLGDVVSVDRLVLDTSAAQPFDFPRAYEVRVSDDGVNFSNPIASGNGSATTDIALGDTTARYLRIEQTGSDASRWWSMYDVTVYGR